MLLPRLMWLNICRREHRFDPGTRLLDGGTLFGD
jgi:hypothetical protein